MYGYSYSYSYGKIGGGIDLSLYKFTTWTPTTNIDGTREIVNEGSANNLKLYSGSGTSFNGTNQSLDSFTLPLDATHMIYLKDNVKVYTTTLLDFSTIVPVGTYKDVYYFNRALTTLEQDKYTSQPEQFYIDALADNTCVLNMPMNDKGSTAHDYVSNTDYPKLNYTTDQNISNLQYGTQDLKLPHTLGLRDGTITPWIKGDGISYGDTGWIPSATEDWWFSLVQVYRDGSPHLNGVQILSNEERMLIGDVGNGSAYVRLGNGSLSFGSLAEGDVFILNGSFNKDTKLMYIYLNGIGVGNVGTGSFSGCVQSFFLGNPRGQNFPLIDEIKDFKVDIGKLTSQKALDLYNDAVAKGLLT